MCIYVHRCADQTVVRERSPSPHNRTTLTHALIPVASDPSDIYQTSVVPRVSPAVCFVRDLPLFSYCEIARSPRPTRSDDSRVCRLRKVRFTRSFVWSTSCLAAGVVLSSGRQATVVSVLRTIFAFYSYSTQLLFGIIRSCLAFPSLMDTSAGE